MFSISFSKHPGEIHGRNRTWINKDYRTNRAYSTLPYEFSVETKIAMLTAFSGLLSAAHSRIYGCSAILRFRKFKQRWRSQSCVLLHYFGYGDAESPAMTHDEEDLSMRIRVAVTVFLFLSACSVVPMKLTPDPKPVAFDGGGGLPTPCIPHTVCPQQ